MTDPLLVPCPLCNGLAVAPRAVWVYEHGCAFGHYDTEEDPCPECEGNGQTLVDGEPITLEDLQNCPCGGWDCTGAPEGPLPGCPYVAAAGCEDMA